MERLTFPGRGVSTSTRSARKTASLMECVTITTVFCRACQMRNNSTTHTLPGQGIQRAEGFVKQQQIRVVDERPSDGHALRHPAGEVLWPAVFESFNPTSSINSAAFACISACGLSCQFQRQDDILQHVPPGHEVGILENKTSFRQSAGFFMVNDLS